jgi:hypothetical protein
MNEWELTDEEIQGIITDGYIRHVALGIPGCRQAIDRDIAAAAQRKLAEWLVTNSFDTWEPAAQAYVERHQVMAVWDKLLSSLPHHQEAAK